MAAEPQSCTFAKGYLIKHNRDHRTSNLLPGAKYKRRWVEVTEHTFVYSPSQQDALTGRCSVFAIGDMMWVKADGDTKFMVKFPERTLKFKVAAGGKAEREQWVAALQAARKQHTAATQALNSGTAKLEHLQKALLSPGPDLIARSRHSAESCSSGMMLSSAGTSLAGSTLTGAAPAASGVSAMPPGLTWTGSGFGGTLEQQTECAQQQQLSPRSLLASARAGMALVSSAAGTPRVRTPPPAAAATNAAPQPKPVQELFFAHLTSDTEDEEEEEDDSASEAGSSDSDAEQHAQGDATEAAEPSGGTASEDPVGASQAAAAAEHAACRPVLAKRMTPGVLLASPRPPTPLAASPAHASPASPPSPHPSTLPANPLKRVGLGPAAAAAASPSAAGRTLSVSAAQADEVLRLDDPSDSEPDSPAATQQPALDVYSTPLYSTHRPSRGSRSSVEGPGPPAAAALSGDQVLRLDEEDVLPAPITEGLPLSSTQQHHGQQAHSISTGQMAAATEAAASSAQARGLRPGVLQVGGSRPGSGDSSRPGSAYRPATPLKSCLRNIPSTNPAGYTP